MGNSDIISYISVEVLILVCAHSFVLSLGTVEKTVLFIPTFQVFIHVIEWLGMEGTLKII